MPKGYYQTDKHRGRPKGRKNTKPPRIAPDMLAEFTEQMAFRCTPEQRERLEWYAAQQRITVAEALRRLVEHI